MKLPKYVQAWVDPEGRAYHYFRRAGSSRVRLPGLPWSPPFMAAYQQGLDATPVPIGVARTRPGSLDAALAQYYPSKDFGALRPGTQRLWHAILEGWRNEHGTLPIGKLPPGHIDYMLEKMRPHAARNWLKAARHFCKFCVKHKLIATDPTLGIKAPPVPRSDGHYTWSEEDIAQFEAVHPVGSKMRLAFALGLYTAQRRGDVIRMGRQHLSDCLDEELRELGVQSMLFVRQQKTGMEVNIPIHPELQKILDATPSKHLTFLTTKSGKSYGAGFFSDEFRVWCDAAGLPQACTFHGLRKTALTRAANAGDTPHEIAALGGHKSLKEVQRYTEKADRARLARDAMVRKLAMKRSLDGGREASKLRMARDGGPGRKIGVETDRREGG
jgi:integrase